MPIRPSKRKRPRQGCPKEAAAILTAFDAGDYLLHDGRFYTAVRPERVTQAPVGDYWPLGPVEYAGAYRVRVLSKEYSGGRLAWLIEHRAWPDGNVRHLNGDKSDNRIDNLFVGPKPREYRQSNYKGVRYRDGKWEARAGDYSIGAFATEREAAHAWDDWAIENRQSGTFLNSGGYLEKDGTRRGARASKEIARALREAVKKQKRRHAARKAASTSARQRSPAPLSRVRQRGPAPK